MPDLVPLNTIFSVEYGNKLDKNKLKPSTNGVNFISRSSNRLGIDGQVKLIENVEPYESGAITVTLGGTYLLSAFVQPATFYTAQNIKVLRPLGAMTFNEKIFYCMAIAHNRFRYTSHGREANKTLNSILVPRFDDLPKWVNDTAIAMPDAFSSSGSMPALPLDFSNWKEFCFQELFEISRGIGPRKKSMTSDGTTPLVTSTDANNGWTGFTLVEPTHQAGVITVNRNGSVGEAFYQPKAFTSTEDVHIFKPKFDMNEQVALFLTTLIRRERYRFGYGRKWGLGRMNESVIRLPFTDSGDPDWHFMANYIKSLPYGSSI
jgi:Type I restriction modification DNA specificity domain